MTTGYRWVQLKELPAVIAEECELGSCPAGLLRAVREAVEDNPDVVLQREFGLWRRGRLLCEVTWIAWLEIEWDTWRARVRLEHARDLGISGSDLRRRFTLVVARRRVREKLEALRRQAPVLFLSEPGGAPPTQEAPPDLKEPQEATNEQIDAMLRRLWGQRSNPKRGLSRDKEALKQWRGALAEDGLTSNWRAVRARYEHDDNKYLRGTAGR